MLRPSSCCPCPISIFSLLLLLFAGTAALAQEVDEPGLGDAPQEQQPAIAPAALELGGSDLRQQTRARCRQGSPCPLLPELIRALGGPEGASAAQALGELGDPRALHPLAQAAVYGDPASQPAARAALAELVAHPSANAAAARIAKHDPDPEIRRLLAAALSLQQDADVTPGQPAPPAEQLADPETTRVAWGPTAFGRPAGTWNWTIYNIGYWSFDYGVTDNLEVGLQTLPPIGVVAVLPTVKLSLPLGENARLGLRLLGGFFYPYIENDQELRVGIYGGGPILTLGSADLLVNLSVTATGMTLAEKKDPYSYPYYDESVARGDSETRYETTWSVLPNVGVSWRFHRRLKLNAELYAPLGDFDYSGKVWVLLYGLRIFDQSIYGDINFVYPFMPDFWDFMKYLPIGIPMLAFGFQW